MKILIATGIYPPDIGGPAIYAKKLNEEFNKAGHETSLLCYNKEKKMPTGIRHLWFFFRVLKGLPHCDLVLALDTFSVGLPAILAAKILKKKCFLRVGGDFLWESYVEEKQTPVTLSAFYNNFPKLNFKLNLIYILSKYILKNSQAVIFNSDWLRKIFIGHYKLEESRCLVVENYFGEKIISSGFKKKNYLWTGRDIYLKNLNILKQAFTEAKKITPEIILDLYTNLKQEELLEKIQDCYAVILPSLSDVAPNFIIDAFRLGKPFIMTKESGYYELFKDVGLFANPLDIEDLKNKILFLAREDNYFEYQNKVNNFRIERGWPLVAQEFLKIFQI